VRVMIAVDASAGSYAAVQLFRRMAWPPDTTLRLFSVAEPGGWIPPGPDMPVTGGLVGEREVAAYLQGQQIALTEGFLDTGMMVERAVVTGRPGDAIVEEAKRTAADLVVVGARGHGRIASLLLGSVSAEVVDRAPCPVLVARRTSLTRAVLAVDGSPSARAAAHLVASWPAFDGASIRVVTVPEPARSWAASVAPAFLRRGQPNAGEVRDPMDEASGIAADAVAGLRRAGRHATADIRDGPAAEGVVAASSEFDADLVVIGCRGRNTLSRVLLGSVARDVILASEASVLTVRHTRGRSRRR
jgi:nucleotide-binding universal stress UspA family protein